MTAEDQQPRQPGTQVQSARAGAKCWADDVSMLASPTAVRPTCDRLATYPLGLCAVHAQEILGR